MPSVPEARRALCASPRKTPFVPCKSASSDFKVLFQFALRPRRGRATSYAPTAVTKRGRQFIAGFPLAPGTLSTGFHRNLKAPAAAEKSCTRQTLSGRPFYRAKMLPIAAPVVHGNRPAARMPPNFMTALGGRGDVSGPLPPGGNSPPARTLPTFGQDRK